MFTVHCLKGNVEISQCIETNALPKIAAMFSKTVIMIYYDYSDYSDCEAFELGMRMIRNR